MFGKIVPVTCFTDDPGQTKKKHDAPDVEKACHEHALHPVHLVSLALWRTGLLQTVFQVYEK
jgi:hypothetical protein